MAPTISPSVVGRTNQPLPFSLGRSVGGDYLDFRHKREVHSAVCLPEGFGQEIDKICDRCFQNS